MEEHHVAKRCPSRRRERSTQVVIIQAKIVQIGQFEQSGWDCAVNVIVPQIKVLQFGQEPNFGGNGSVKSKYI
jgi:hypothetical protein